MKIKCGRREFDVNHKDRIVYNGAVYQLVTKHYREGFYYATPQVSVKLFKSLLNDGMIVLSKSKYRFIVNDIVYVSPEYDMYEFTEKADD